MKKEYLFIFAFLLSLASASAWTIHSFTNITTATENLTYSPSQNNYSRYVSIPANITILGANVTIKGINDNTTSNITIIHGYNQTSYSGIFTFPGVGTVANPDRAQDGVWGTYARESGTSFTGYYEVNFSIPLRTFNEMDPHASYQATWKTQTGGVLDVYFYCYIPTNNSYQLLAVDVGYVGVNATVPVNKHCYNNTNNITIQIKTVTGGGTTFDIYDIEIIEYGAKQSPRNVTVIANGNVKFHQDDAYSGMDFLDVTSFLQNHTKSLIEFDFLSNDSGILNYSSLNVEYLTLNVTTFDEGTGGLITSASVITVQNGISQYNFTTSNGYGGTPITFTNGYWTISVNNPSYPVRFYDMYFQYPISMNLNAFLYANPQNVTFTIQDSITSLPVAGVLLSMSRYVNGTYTLVDQKLSDVNGNINFYYSPNTMYSFFTSMTNYQTKTFNLNPITDPQYRILINPSSTYSNDSDYFGVNAVVSPEEFYTDTQNNLTVTFYSPSGILTSYSANVTYPGGFQTASGSTNIGSILSLPFTPSGSVPGDKVNVSLSYDTTYGNWHTFSFSYWMTNSTQPSGSMFSNIGKTYGMGILERLLIMVIISLILGGLAMNYGGPDAGVVVGVISQGIVAYLLAINVLFIVPSIIVAFFVVSRRTQ